MTTLVKSYLCNQRMRYIHPDKRMCIKVNITLTFIAFFSSIDFSCSLNATPFT